MVSLEHPKGAEKVWAPPRERVKPDAENHVLREGAGLQPVLGQPTANADRRAGLASDLAGEEQIQLFLELLPRRSGEHQGQDVVQYPRWCLGHAEPPPRHRRDHRGPARDVHQLSSVGEPPGVHIAKRVPSACRTGSRRASRGLRDGCLLVSVLTV